MTKYVLQMALLSTSNQLTVQLGSNHFDTISRLAQQEIRNFKTRNPGKHSILIAKETRHYWWRPDKITFTMREA